MINNFDIQNKKNMAGFGAVTSSFGMNTQPGADRLDMQAQLDAASLNDAATKINDVASDSYIGQRINPSDEVDRQKQLLITIPTWVLINQAMDQYNKKCGGLYENSIIAKFGKLGDKISGILFERNAVGRGIKKAGTGIGNFFRKNIYEKSNLMKAFNTTPAVPELNLVKSQVGGMTTMQLHDVMSNLDSFLEPATCAKDLDYLGATKKEIEAVERDLAKLVKEDSKVLRLQTEEFRLLSKNATPSQINAFKNCTAAERLATLKELKITKALNFSSLAEYEQIKQAPEKYINRILEALEKSDKNIFARDKYSNKNLFTKLKGELFGRKVKISEAYNKLFSATGADHKSVLGRTGAKLSNQVLEGATSRISGGKGAALMQAFFLAEVIMRANKQEGIDNKFKSFMERFAELIGFFVFMPPSTKLTYKLAGLKYAGMTPEQVDTWRKAVLEFNEHVINHDWTKEVYKQKYKELMTKFRPKTKNPFTWIGRKVGDIMSVGLDQVRPYSRKAVTAVDISLPKLLQGPGKYLKDVGLRIKDVFINPKYWMKQAAGYPARFILPMFILVPFFNKYLVKGVNAIFGKPAKDALADEGKEDKTNETSNSDIAKQDINAEQQSFGQNPQMPTQQSTVFTKDVQPNSPFSRVTGSHTIDTSNNSESRYIPSSKPVVIEQQKERDDAYTNAMKRSEIAQKSAEEILAGNFPKRF